MYIILFMLYYYSMRKMDEQHLLHLVSSFNVSPNSQRNIKYIIRIFNKMTHYFILVYIKKDVQIYSIILIINRTK